MSQTLASSNPTFPIPVPEEIFTVDSKAPTSFDSYGTLGDAEELGQLTQPAKQVLTHGASHLFIQHTSLYLFLSVGYV
jgi:hypothetical protein